MPLAQLNNSSLMISFDNSIVCLAIICSNICCSICCFFNVCVQYNMFRCHFIIMKLLPMLSQNLFKDYLDKHMATHRQTFRCAACTFVCHTRTVIEAHVTADHRDTWLGGIRYRRGSYTRVLNNGQNKITQYYSYDECWNL